MAQVGKLLAEGVKQGKFKGGSQRKGWEGATEFHGFSYKVEAPFDANRGSYSGKRRHGTVNMISQIDDATALYWVALVNNETMKSVQFSFFKPSNDGKETNYYTITLTNASVVGVTQRMEKDVTHSEGRDTFEVAEISFAFQKIECTFTQGGKGGSDDWNAPV